MKVLLDTDIVSYLFRAGDERALGRFKAYAPGEVAISAITAAELMFGAELSGAPRHRVMVDRICRALLVAPFEAVAARAYGTLRAALHRRGTPIGSNDMLIAAHAIALGIPLATNNLREFRRVPGLKVDNWLG